jgi:hypothetical protein
MRRLLYVVIVVLLFCSPCFAQTVIKLKSGETIEGTLLERNDKFVKIDFFGVPITCWLDEIKSIQLEDGTTITPAPPVKQEAASLVPPSQPPETITQTSSNNVSSKLTQLSQERYPPQKKSHSDAEAASSTTTSARSFAPLAIIILFFFLLGLAVYVFFAICLQKIAQKTVTSNAWFAWVPILNLILMCDIAEKPRWWAALFLLGLIPYIGFIATTIINVLLMIKICERMGKPIWWGIITIIPFASIVIFALLAFGSQEEENIIPYEPKAGGITEPPPDAPLSEKPIQPETYEQTQ